jgi:hypothetical protein
MQRPRNVLFAREGAGKTERQQELHRMFEVELKLEVEKLADGMTDIADHPEWCGTPVRGTRN